MHERFDEHFREVYEFKKAFHDDFVVFTKLSETENIKHPVIALQYCPNCEVEDTEIIGSDVGSPIPGVTLAAECKRHCQANTACEFYMWSVSSQECLLKSSDAQTAVASGIPLK